MFINQSDSRLYQLEDISGCYRISILLIPAFFPSQSLITFTFEKGVKKFQFNYWHLLFLLLLLLFVSLRRQIWSTDYATYFINACASIFSPLFTICSIKNILNLYYKVFFGWYTYSEKLLENIQYFLNCRFLRKYFYIFWKSQKKSAGVPIVCLNMLPIKMV